MSVRKKIASAALPLVVLSLTACASIGPRRMLHDSFNYTDALSSLWQRQMLINMVKARYGDTPVFLEVASVIGQYELQSQAQFQAAFADPISVGPATATGVLANIYSMGAGARYTDRPTITYTPLSGERFARSLMKPIPPPAILTLIQAGYPVDLVLRVAVHSVNSVRNRYGGAARARQADPEFYPLLERLRRIQNSGAIGIRIQKTNETEGMVMTFRGQVDKALEEDILAVRKTLRLDPAALDLRVAYGAVAKDDKEIAILSRSMLEIIFDFASSIEVPPGHVEEKRVPPTMLEELPSGISVAPLIRIQSSLERPRDAFIAVPYRSHWFWIDDRDFRSKALFSFLSFVFTLTETGGKEGAPVVTISAGGP